MSKKGKVVPGKDFKIFAVFCHGTELEKMEERLIKQMGVGSNKKIFVVTVNVPDPAAGEETIWEAKKLMKQADQIEEGLRKCRKDIDAVWPTLKTTLGEDAKKYWTGDVNPTRISNFGLDKVVSFDESEIIFPNKIKKADMLVLNGELDDKIQICDYYVVIFGKLENQTLLNLLVNKQPLQAVIHFIPCPESELNANFPELQKNIDSLRKTPDSKNIGIFVESLDIEQVTPQDELSIQEKQKFAVKMNEQFTNYLYDIEMLAQQFIVYQQGFVEDSTEPDFVPSVPSLMQTPIEEPAAHAADEHDEVAAVGVFLDDLLSTVDRNDDLHQTFSSSSICCLSPFIENNYGKIIVEEPNELLRSAVVSKLNLGTYWRLANMLTSGNNILDGEGNVDISIELPRFYELLNWVSFVQRFEANKSNYDSCRHIDLGDLLSILIFRRLFNEIVGTQKKFPLSTKLAFRDFSHYIAPDLPDIIRNFDKSLGIPKFVGIDIDGVFKEVSNSEEVFRFAEGSIRSCIENWSGSEQVQPITVKLQLLGTDVFFYHSMSPRLRIITEQNLMLNIDLTEDDLAIEWPNGCRIRYLSSGGIKAVEQCYENKFEIKRFYTPEGLIIRFLKDDRVEVLTPYGVVYMLYFGDAFSSQFNFENASQIDESEVSDCIRFVRSLGKYGIHSDHFEVTQSDGWKMKVSHNGNIFDEVANYLVYEWTDYREGKKYLDRDDGVKMIWRKDSFTCYYPSGNRITTTVDEDCIRTNFGCTTNIMDNIFGNPNPTFVAKGSNQAKLQDCYTTYNLNYSMQHKNFATVEVWGKDKMEIHCPHDFKLILKEEPNYNDDSSDPVNNDLVVLIDIGKELSFHIAAGVCTVLTSACIRRKDKKFKVEMNWNSDVEDILTFNNQNFSLKIDANGKMQLNETIIASYSETLYMIAKENTFAIEFLPSKKYSQFITAHVKNKYFYNLKNQTVLLKPLFPINKTFSMPVPSKAEMELTNFKADSCCIRPKKPATEDLVFTARVFNKLTRNLNGINVSNFIGKINYDENTLANQLDGALLYFFGSKMKGRSPKWENKINAHQQDIENKKKRSKFYHKILQTKDYPKYFDFRDCQYNIKNIPISVNFK